MQLKRIKYISNFAKKMRPDEIDSLISQAEQNNKELEITGVIIAMGEVFFQIIEGPAKAIDEVYKRIQEDKRHKNVLLLHSEWGVKSRIFPDWSMKRIDLSSETSSRMAPLRVILETVFECRERIEKLTKTLELAIWEIYTDSRKE